MNSVRHILAQVESWAADPRLAVRLARFCPTRPEAETRRLVDYQKILVIKPDEIGDVVMSTPFLRELRHNCPRAHITLVVKAGLERLVANCPYVNETISYNWDLPGRMPHTRRFLRVLGVARALARRAFDLAILLRWDADHYQAGQLLALSGAPRRVGYSSDVAEWKRSLNAGLDDCFTEALAQPVLQHEVLQNLELLRRLGGSMENDRLELWIGEDDRRWAGALLSSLGSGKKIALGVGARQAAKRWPFERFRETTEVLAKDGFRFVLLGSHEDRACGEWPAESPGLDFRGLLTLDQSAAILESCDMYLGNDTGFKHIAAAWGKPVVEISCHPQGGDPRAWPWPDRFHAWGVPFVQLRPSAAVPPCTDRSAAEHAHSIAAVPASAAIQAVRSLPLPLSAAA